ncbi:olfactory receptor 52D1-like [Discoglossus pictus]
MCADSSLTRINTSALEQAAVGQGEDEVDPSKPDPQMFSSNITNGRVVSFVLLGIPGLEKYHSVILIPLFIMFVCALIENSVIHIIIIYDKALHAPMYFFLCMLAQTHLFFTLTIMPKLFGIFWFHAGEINYYACLIQMFFVHFLTLVETGILTAMAFDRYVAICHPLRYSSILTGPTIARIGTLFVIRGIVIILRAVLNLPAKSDQSKAFSTCTSHICVISLFYIPGFFTLLTYRIGGQNVPPAVHSFLSILYLLMTPTFNPIVYGVKTKQIRENVKKCIYWNRKILF